MNQFINFRINFRRETWAWQLNRCVVFDLSCIITAKSVSLGWLHLQNILSRENCELQLQGYPRSLLMIAHAHKASLAAPVVSPSFQEIVKFKAGSIYQARCHVAFIWRLAVWAEDGHLPHRALRLQAHCEILLQEFRFPRVGFIFQILLRDSPQDAFIHIKISHSRCCKCFSFRAIPARPKPRLFHPKVNKNAAKLFKVLDDK